MKFRKKQRKVRRPAPTDWSGCGTRDNYIRTIVSMGLNVDGSRPKKEGTK